MNSLSRDIRAGEEVVISEGHFLGVVHSEKERIFTCDSGFGMRAFTCGTKIFGHWKATGAMGMVRGSEIEVEATLRLQTRSRLTAGVRK